jgi:hypothetical protein
MMCPLQVLKLVQGEKYFVHYFHPTNVRDRDSNGLALLPEHFRKFERPDPILVAWHYTQAVRMRIRGYSVGMMPLRRLGSRKRPRPEEVS